jgi:hypothetical protein
MDMRLERLGQPCIEFLIVADPLCLHEKKTSVIYTFLFGAPIKPLNLTIVWTLLERKGNELENLLSLAISCLFFFSPST